MKRSSFRITLAWVGLLAVAALVAPLWLNDRALAMDFRHVLEPPSWAHPFGTDSLGRDLLARIMCGARVSLGMAAFSIGIAVALGVVVGAAAGYFGGWVDRALMALTDVMLCFPAFFLILAVIAVLGPGILHVIAIIGLTGWMGTARLVRAEVLSLRERDFALALRALGASHGRILFLHLVPNAAAPVLVNAVLGFSSAVLLETGLSFLGIGVQPPTPSWGNLLTDGKGTLGAAWWMTVFPGLAIFLTVLAANVAGERLREFAAGER